VSENVHKQTFGDLPFNFAVMTVNSTEVIVGFFLLGFCGFVFFFHSQHTIISIFFSFEVTCPDNDYSACLWRINELHMRIFLV